MCGCFFTPESCSYIHSSLILHHHHHPAGLVGELPDVEILEPHWKRGGLKWKILGPYCAACQRAYLTDWWDEEITELTEGGRGGSQHGMAARALESAQDSPQACWPQPAQVNALWFWVPQPTKGSTLWAGLLSLEQHESPCNGIFMCFVRGFVSFVCWCMCLFLSD